MEMETVSSPDQATGPYRDMLIRLMTRQLYAETATAEVFGRSIELAPTWEEKYRQAEFAFEEAQHSQYLVDLLEDLGQNGEAIIASRPPAGEFWGLGFDDWLDVAVFNFTVDRAGSHQIMEYRQSSYEPWATRMEIVLEDEEEHYGSGVEVIARICRDPDRRRDFQARFDRLLPVTLKRAFGRPDGPDNEYCLKTGLKRAHTYEIQARYLREMRPYLERAGLSFPAVAALETEGVDLGPESREIVASLRAEDR
jgi:1,2-phenylacetyl-CoA epoxidase catalytic subunit